ncbi:MAG: DUF4437 domain-containing protein [Alphaproteobacteria bacterium]
MFNQIKKIPLSGLKASALSAAIFMFAGSHAHAHDVPKTEVVLRPDITFQPLNPVRGDASPRAGVLWGDIEKDVPSGVLLEFADGFSSPPHIHNITYRAVVISGAVHNDDPGAESTWMGPGSFWTQPAGESHITAAAKGGKATAFLEILEGPYLVQPSDQAFENGERPINLDQSNIVWLNSSDVTWVDQPSGDGLLDAPQVAFLWGNTNEGELSGTLLKLPAGYEGDLKSLRSDLRVVVIQGQVGRQESGEESFQTLEPGSYFASTGKAEHHITCQSDQACTLYLRTKGKYLIALD